MNIAIFSPNQNPYSETFIQAHKNNLRGNIFFYYGQGKNIKLKEGEVLSNSLERLKLKFENKVLNDPSHNFWSKPLLRSLKKHKIESVLIEYGNHAFHLLPVLKSLKIPIVVHFHGYDASIYEVIRNCNNYKDVFKIATTIIAVSKVMEGKLLELGCPKEKLVLNVYGPNPIFHKIEPNFKKAQFISVGRFVDKKAPYLTVLAFQKVLRNFPKAKLLMAGDGGLLNSCKNIVRYLNLQNNVEFLGVIDKNDFKLLLSESLAFVQHSIIADNGDMEGTPVAILEASAAGLPILSTYHAGIPDVVIHKQTGLLCKEHDVEAMSNNMLQLLMNKELVKAMGFKGKSHILENFNMQKHINTIQKQLQG
ncbi:MAG: glycosyltransferase [Winogradskyella sp.]